MALVPCYREEESVPNVVKRAFLVDGVDTVVVVDDGSPDRTADAAREAGAVVLRHDANRGKGAAINTGFQYALSHNFSAVVTLDGDGQHAPEEISDLIRTFHETGADVVIGSRMGDTKLMPWERRVVNRLMSLIINKSLGSGVSDTQSGFRLYSSAAMNVCVKECTDCGFSAESESLLQLSMRGFKFAECRISTIYGNEKSKIRPMKDTWKFFRMIFIFRARRRKYMRSGDNSIPGGPNVVS